MQLIKELVKLSGQGITEDFTDLIELWLSWYRNQPDFHNYTINTLNSVVKKKRYSLNMAKKVCEDWVDLVYSEGVYFNIDNERVKKVVDEVLESNNFKYEFANVLEKTFALGTTLMVQFYDNESKKTVIDFIEADMILPTEYDNGKINSVITVSQIVDDGGYKNIVAEYKFDGQYFESNYLEYFSEDDDKLGVLVSSEDENKVSVQANVCHFQIIKPNICNNFEIRNPMGVSIFGNSIDTLQAMDLKYDSFASEFEMGRKRIIVSSDLVKSQITEANGVVSRVRYFDSSETVFQAMPFDADNSEPIRHIDPTLRTQEHIDAINYELNLLSQKVGLGSGFYEFTNKGLKTATEVISENSDTYRTIRKHQQILAEALKEMVASICEIEGITESYGITIDFDDSIINDKNTQIDNGIKEVSAGLMSKLTYLIDVKGYTEKQALEELQRINDESGLQSIDMIVGG